MLFFPDPTPTADESRSFEAIVGEGVLDEDLGTDEVYAKLTLTNLNTHVSISKKTKDWFKVFKFKALAAFAEAASTSLYTNHFVGSLKTPLPDVR